MIRLAKYIWKNADINDRARLVFYLIAMTWVLSAFIIDYSRPVYVTGYLIVSAGILYTVGTSWWELRAARRRVDRALRDAKRRKEIEYLEWLHDASPDD